jgi:peptidoglycan/xylan/chitin deacetylase (PgdA/CDA1 family)
MRRALRPLALAYHGVARVPLRSDPYGLFVAPEALRRQVALLRRRGYRLVTFSELVARTSAGDGAGLASLTFDDGFADNDTVLAPLLAELQAPATVFAVAGWLGGEHPDVPGTAIIDGEGLRRLHRAGVEVGGHTWMHTDLTTLDAAGARAELERGRIELEGLLDAPVTVAAYPYGRATEETIRACAEAGFVAACRTGAQGTGRPLDFPREDMVNGSSQLGLRLKMRGAYQPLMRHGTARALRRSHRILVHGGHVLERSRPREEAVLNDGSPPVESSRS